ncbi:hypothetical protein [Methylobrevis pamukkalensis]|uniref:Flagellar basal body P-ring biosynthesis protein FlgA n=1 Tax=Methylobrevis pamukkalensis TaxID=1439726 RepID=A0A1E3H197_9HYPH|nr:hypothetical protein [Methylobrevis pamukkalensis]ODN69341.1 flagellar basal body P-ring biosynthesis protein FlgA [Methylobrevis pamukkalensis]
MDAEALRALVGATLARRIGAGERDIEITFDTAPDPVALPLGETADLTVAALSYVPSAARFSAEIALPVSAAGA